MRTNSARMGFHVTPPSGWLNDPNGLIQFRGVYHAFFQYSPDWPGPGERCWGHATSTDLLAWEYHGIAIHQDIPEDANGAYSGSAIVEPGAAADGGDRMRIYYTGNVKQPGDFDYILAGREANTITVTSDDGFAFSSKAVLQRNADYPATCSCHVRDPKVWRQDGHLLMVLGARDVGSRGLALLYESGDGLDWRLRSEIRTRAGFGYMWECPGVVQLAGREYLLLCPQGMPAKDADGTGTSWAGYFPLPGRASDTEEVDADAYVEWDGGFDFYAPQTFVDDAGRTILIGWAGMPEEDFKGQPAEFDWIHCLTIPRELSVSEDGSGRLRQWPVREVEGLRGEACVPDSGGVVRVRGRQADVEVDGIRGSFSVRLDGTGGSAEAEGFGAKISCADSSVTLSFDAATGCGRTSRTLSCPGGVRSLRILADNTLLEVFVNGGELAFTSRWFSGSPDLCVRLSGSWESARAWRMASA